MNAPLHPPAAVRTTCPYCGVGCGVLARPDANGGAIVTGDPDGSGVARPRQHAAADTAVGTGGAHRRGRLERRVHCQYTSV
jgi:anaerobic selenocysteine-containing dehydrogenase